MENKVALVTGSGKKRVGWHVAEALVRRGYDLAVHYHDSGEAALATRDHFASLGARTIALGADLTNETHVDELFRRVMQEFGRIDVLVNCAAVWERRQLERVVAVDVRRHFEINVLGTFLCAQRAGLLMVAQPVGGCIINVGDWAEVRPYADYAAYFASKGAIPALSRCLAVELGTRNPLVRVNCILPGPVLLPDSMADEERQRVVNATLLKKEGSPTNVAQAVLFLIDNDFVTGVSLPVDGGRTIYS